MSSFTTPSLIQLDENRRTLEIEAASIVASLTEGPIPMGVDLPLVDAEGYPRADIDVYLAKTLRGQLAKLRTDHAKIMQAVEKGLTNKEGGDEELRERLATKPKPKYDNVHNAWVVRNWDGTCSGIPGGNAVKFEDIGNDLVDGQRRLQLATLGGDAAATSTPASSATSQTTTTAQIRPNRGDVMEAFAVFDQIADNSPAKSAGLKSGDVCTNFGPIHKGNNEALQGLAKVVREASERGWGIEIHVLRDERPVVLVLRPKTWEGRGVLGCHVAPMSN